MRPMIQPRSDRASRLTWIRSGLFARIQVQEAAQRLGMFTSDRMFFELSAG